MRAPLHHAHRPPARLAVVLLRLDPFAVPDGVDGGDELLGGFDFSLLIFVVDPRRRRMEGRVQPIMMVVEHDRDAQLAREGQEVIDGVAELIVLEHEPRFDRGREEGGVVLAEARKSCGFVAEHACVWQIQGLNK